MRRSERASFALLACCTAFAGPIGAAPPAAGTVPPASPSRPALRSTIGQIATRLADDLGPTPKDPLVFVGPVRSDEPAPRSTALAAKLAALVTSSLGPGASARPEPVAMATAQTLGHKAEWLVYLQAEVVRGQLRVNADAYRATRSVWERARRPNPAPAARAYAGGPIDGEVRGYLAPVPLAANRIERFLLDEREVLALACGDLGDPGGAEIVTLSRQRVAVGRTRGDRLVLRRSTPVSSLSPIAPAPLREPIGGVAIMPARAARPAFVDVGITDRARGFRLDRDLQAVVAILGVPFATPLGNACATYQGSALVTSVNRCSEKDPALDVSDIDAPFDAVAAASFVTADGTIRSLIATRDPRTAELKVRVEGKTSILPRSGAQVALADLDQDGLPEVISTLDVLPQAPNGETDALVVTTLQPDGSLRERARTPVPAGIRAVAACPPDGAGAAAIVLATQGELWVVR